MKEKKKPPPQYRNQPTERERGWSVLPVPWYQSSNYRLWVNPVKKVQELTINNKLQQKELGGRHTSDSTSSGCK